MITYFKPKNNKPKKKYKNYKMITTILKSFDTLVIIATTSSLMRLSLTGISLTVIPIAIATACGLSVANLVLIEIIINKNKKHKKHFKKDQQTSKTFHKLHTKSLQEILIDKSEYESLCNIFTKDVDENKNESFL